MAFRKERENAVTIQPDRPAAMRRDRVLDAAGAVFAEKGFHATIFS
jgi:AcrR family transcriptional regulator